MQRQDVIDDLESRLRRVATAERAEQEKRYLKSDLEFWGATVWQIEREVNALSAELGQIPHDELMSLVEVLWSAPVHERRMAAVMFLERGVTLLDVDDLPTIERLIRESKTWALVDGLAADVVGGIVEREPLAAGVVLDRWSADSDFWVRRASLLAELRPIRRGAPLAVFLARADRLLTNASSSSARRSAGCCARPARSARTRWRPGWRRGRIGPVG